MEWIFLCLKRTSTLRFGTLKSYPSKFSPAVSKEMFQSAVHILFWHTVLNVHGDCILDYMNNEADPFFFSMLHFYLSPI